MPKEILAKRKEVDLSLARFEHTTL